MVRLPSVWELIDQFKRICRLRGWWVSDYEDVVHANGEYHSFLWARKVYPRTFRSVITNHNCPIREGLSYKIVNVSYTAWISPEHLPENLILFVTENPHLLKSTALYDLSEAYLGKQTCLKLNETRSVVFHEFERFLEKEYNINFVNRVPPLPPNHIPSAEREKLSLSI